MVQLVGRVDPGRKGYRLLWPWRDVDLGKRQLCVQRSDWNGEVTTPKGGRLRYVPLTVRHAAAFRDHRHLRSSNVLCQDNGQPLTRQMVLSQAALDTAIQLLDGRGHPGVRGSILTTAAASAGEI